LLRGALARLFLQAGDEGAQRRVIRLPPARRARGGGRQRQPRIDLGKAPMAGDVAAPADDAYENATLDVPPPSSRTSKLAVFFSAT